MRININFGGFYGSCHESLIDAVIEDEKEYYSNEYENRVKLKKYLQNNNIEFWELYNYKDIHLEYSKLWLGLFKDWFKNEFDLDIPLKFIELSSPKYYNYSTDVIIASVKLKKHEIKSLLHNDVLNIECDLLDRFENMVSRVTTSGSGYFAFYDYDKVINMIDKDNKRVCFECLLDVLIDIFNNEFLQFDDFNDHLYNLVAIDRNKHNYNY